MTKKLLEQIKKQLITDRKKHWTLPQWVAEEMFKHIESLEMECELLGKLSGIPDDTSEEYIRIECEVKKIRNLRNTGEDKV